MPRSLPAAPGGGLSDTQLAAILGEIILGVAFDGLDVPVLFGTIGYDIAIATNRLVVIQTVDHVLSIIKNLTGIIKDFVDLGIEIKNFVAPADLERAFYCVDSQGNVQSIACILQAINNKLTSTDDNGNKDDLANLLRKWKEDCIFIDTATGKKYTIAETLGRLLLTGYMIPRT